MFQENRNFPNRQRKPVKSTGEMQESFQRGSAWPLAILVAIAVVILAAVTITTLFGQPEDPPEPSVPLVTTAPTQVPTETTVPTQETVDTTTPVLAPGEIAWTMYGTWITPDGKTGEETELTVLGMITQTDTHDSLIADIRFPDSFRYHYQPLTEFVSFSRQIPDLPYLVCPHFSYNKVAHDAVWAYLALCPEKEYMIFRWDESQDRYLVASTNPDADPQEILDYFQGFIDFHIKK